MILVSLYIKVLKKIFVLLLLSGIFKIRIIFSFFFNFFEVLIYCIMFDLFWVLIGFKLVIVDSCLCEYVMWEFDLY